tara:strand:+ start:14068 stop:14367 length:300 start_codon:yes stop_codon:yes gene_type:complete
LIIDLLISSFVTVLIAELGDKTQLATLTLSGSSQKPLAVLLGSASALILASLVGVLAGGSISTFVPEIYLKLIASTTFFIIGSKLIYDSFGYQEFKDKT